MGINIGGKMMLRKHYVLLAFILTVAIFCGCSGGGDTPTTPVANPVDPSRGSDTHHTWGLWQFIIDPVNETFDIVQLRSGNMHLNALLFLEPPPLVNLTLESLEFSGDEVYAGIGLRHPFLGLTEFTGFDVCGIFITNGSVSGFDDPDLRMAGEEDTHLMNPDGFSRWWNPAEFPVNDGTIFSYKDGLLGTPDSIANYNSILNAYKFFCDDFTDPDDEMSSLDPASRCIFSAGQKNIRMYRIKLGGEGLIFNYAIDACWEFPTGDPPWKAPDSFGPGANRPEAWNISITELDNTLWNDGSGSGGDLSLLIDVWDHFDADLNTVKVESPGNFTFTESLTPVGGGIGYSTYQIDITDATPDELSIDLLVTVECEAEGYQDLLPGKMVSAYFTGTAPVSSETPSFYGIDCGNETRIEYSNVNTRDEIEPAICSRPDGTMYIGFIQQYWDNPPHRVNYPRESYSSDNGQTFSYGSSIGYWNGHGGTTNTFNNKITRGPDGYLWITYNNPPGHTLGRLPYGYPYQPPYYQMYGSHSGTPVGHAGEMLYTSEGYPMMFGDSGYTIRMRRGDYPNQGGTGTWPVYIGTEYVLVPGAWLSIARSTGITSDGICRLVYWKTGVNGPIRMLSSDDISGTSWTTESIIETGAAEIWVGAHDPSLWIDEDDRFHVLYTGDTWMGTARLVYAYSDDGVNWTNDIIDNAGPFTDLLLNDTEVVTVNAYGEQFIIVSYEYHDNVYCQWKMAGEAEFSDPMQVNVHNNAKLPTLYPNGAEGITFTYQADGDYANLDIFYRTCNIIELD
jgi:hypothetical protein